MRSKVLVRALVVATTAGVMAGGLTAAGASAAAPAPPAPPAVSVQNVGTFSTVQLGLNSTRAKYLQCHLRLWMSYPGRIDGLLGPESWKAMQRMLRNYGYTGNIDGIVGSGTVKALQRQLKRGGFYTGNIDGIAGPNTQAGFRGYVDSNYTRKCW